MSEGRIAGGSPAMAAAQRQGLIERVRELLGARRVVDAEQVLLSALRQNADDVELLELLADFYVEVQRPAEAVQLLTRCLELAPGRSGAYFALAAVLERLGRVADIVDLYTRLCSVQPDLAVAHFNRAVYLRRMDRLDEAVLAYRSAIALHIDGAADAWSNIGVILGALERHADARAAFTQALVADPRWIPALYNLALLHEEFGERDAALELFQRVLAIDPGYHDALVRIIYSLTVKAPDDPSLDRVRAVLQRDDLAPAEREALLFALGKALMTVVVTTMRLPRTRPATISRARVPRLTTARRPNVKSRRSAQASTPHGSRACAAFRHVRSCSSAACTAPARRCSNRCWARTRR